MFADVSQRLYALQNGVDDINKAYVKEHNVFNMVWCINQYQTYTIDEMNTFTLHTTVQGYNFRIQTNK